MGTNSEEMVVGRASSNARWSFLGLGVKVLVQGVGAFVIARIVGLDPYGTMSLGVIYVTVTNLLLDQGMGQALIRADAIRGSDIATVQRTTVTLALIAMVVTWGIAGPLGSFYSDAPGLAGVLIGLSLGLVFKAVGIPATAVLQREFQFRWLAISTITSSVVGVAASLAVALLGGKAQSLVAQMLVTDSLYAVSVLRQSGFHWRGANVAALRGMVGLTSEIAGSQWLGFISRNADNALIGKVLGAGALSQYAVSYRLMLLPITNLTMVANRVMLPTYSQLRGDLAGFRRSFLKSSKLMALTASPPMALLIVFAQPLILGVMGPAWKGAIVPTQVLALVAIIQVQSSLITPAIIAFGRTRWQLKWSLISMILTVAVFAGTVHWGLNAVCIGYCILNVVTVPVPIALVGRFGNFGQVDFLRAVGPGLTFGAITLAVGAGVRFLMEQAGSPHLVTALAGGSLAGLVALGGLRLLLPSSLRELRELLPTRSGPPSPADTQLEAAAVSP